MFDSCIPTTPPRFKIGFTGNVKERLAKYRTSYPEGEMRFLYPSLYARDIEANIKTEFAESRVLNDNDNKSEWIEESFMTIIIAVISEGKRFANAYGEAPSEYILRKLSKHFCN